MSVPKISIIVPVYNVEKYLRRCIDSILSQTFQDFECILVDDGSSDNCPVICDEYAEKDSRIRVIHQKNAGVSSARNAGLDVAYGEWIGFIDSDDWCDSDMFWSLYENAVKYNADVSICDFRIVTGSCKTENKIIKKKPQVYNKYEAKIKLFTYFSFGGICCSKLVKHTLISQNNLRYNVSVSYFEDWLFFFELFTYVQKVIYSPLQYYNYFRNPESITAQYGLTDAIRGGLASLDKLILQESNNKIKKKIILLKIICYSNICAMYILQNDCNNDNFLALKRNILQNIGVTLLDVSVSFRQKIKCYAVMCPWMYRKVNFVWKLAKRLC